MRRRLAVGICTAVGCSLALAAPAQADFVVDDLGDPAVGLADGICDADMAPGGDGCTLREAILEANATDAHDTLTFSVTGTHMMAGQMNPTEPITIDGNGSGASETVIDGIDAFRLFLLTNDASATFRDLRLQDGGIADPNGDGGAAIRTTSLDLTLDNVTVTSNQITGAGNGSGAGILSDLPVGQTVTITDSAITNNTITSGGNNGGAGIFSVDTLNMTNSTVSGNTITAGTGTAGGGIVASTDLNIQRSTISGNSLVSGVSFGATGGGIHASTNVGVKTIANSTISTNTAGTVNGNGGGANFDGPATITNTTFEDNNSILGGDDLHVGVATVTVQNTIFGSGASACNGSVMSATPGNNIDDGFSCMLGNTNGNRDDTDAMLGPLMLNAPGTTMTHALLPLSPAIDAATVGPMTDQRGVPRPQGEFCDIGAFEVLTVGSDAPGCAGFPAVVPPPVVTPTPVTPTTPAAPKKCKKGRKLKKGKCVKKKKKKKN